MKWVRETGWKTHGNAGWEMFSIGARHFAAVANFWDTSMENMNADSEVLEISVSDEGLTFTPFQQFRDSGAHGWEYFEAMGDAFIAVPNYYGKSNIVYKWVPGREDGRSEGRFVLFQNIAIEGPAQCEAYEIGGKTFLAIGENFASLLAIYELDPKEQKFVLRQKMPTPGSGAMAYLSHKNSKTGEALQFMASTSYHSGTAAGWHTQTPIFRWDCKSEGGDNCEWVLMQKLVTKGPHDVEAFAIGTRSFLFFSNDRHSSDPDAEADPLDRSIEAMHERGEMNGDEDVTRQPTEKGSSTDSEVFEYDEASGKFVSYQLLRTDGAHAAEVFHANGHHWLAVANFGDRLGKPPRYQAKSSIFVWEPGDRQGAQSNSGGGGRFVLHQEIDSFGATDAEYFLMPATADGPQKHYLAIANEGDLGSERQAVAQGRGGGFRQWRDSEIFQLDILDTPECTGSASHEEL
jgi:hypothetical protein